MSSITPAEAADPAQVPGLPYAGFWRRLAAFVLDVLALGVLGMGVGIALGEMLAAWGAWARLVGLALVLLYWGVLADEGRSLGKHAMGLQVVDLAGRAPALPVRLFRATVLSAPLLANNLPFSTGQGSNLSPGDWLVAALLGVLVFGIFLAQIATLFVQRPQRRLLHDRLTGTLVVRSGAQVPAGLISWPRHLKLLVAGLLLTSALAPLLMQRSLGASYMPMATLKSRMEALPWVQQAGVLDGWTRGPEGELRYLRLTVVVADESKDVEARTTEIARLVADYPNLRDKHLVQVQLRSGYDIGVWSRWRMRNVAFKTSEVLPQTL